MKYLSQLFHVPSPQSITIPLERTLWEQNNGVFSWSPSFPTFSFLDQLCRICSQCQICFWILTSLLLTRGSLAPI
jgi:hypothetical protein